MKQKLTLLIIMLLLATPVVAQTPHPQDPLIVSISYDFEPFTFLNNEGKPAGMLVDIWRLWSEKTGRHIEFISSDWKTSLENLKNQKADIHSGLLLSPERFEWMSGSQPFYEVGASLFYPSKPKNISDINDLSGQPVAVLKGGGQEQYLKINYPGIQRLTCDTREELVKVTRNGTAKGFIAISQVGASVIDRMGVSGEFDTQNKILYVEKMRAGVLKENSKLLALVNEGFNAISNRALSDIEARWIPDPTKRYFKATGIVQLNPEEEAWQKNHKTIRVGMAPVIPPLKFSEGGVIKGIEPDYLNLLAEYTGLQFEYVICDFQEMDAKVKSGELDMFISFNIPERLAYMTFTEPLMDFKLVIISRSDAPFTSGIGALKGRKIATVKGVKLYEKLLSSYPGIEVVQVNDSDAMFEAVANSKADALISRTYTAGYVMHNYPNLKITGVADLPPEPYLYAIRKDYPELVTILNKAIAAITSDKRDAITQKWSSIQIEYRPNWSEALKWALIIGSAFTFLLGSALFWNRRLRREIDIRIATEKALRDSEQRRRLALEAANAGTWEWDLQTNANIWSDELWPLYDMDPHSCEPSYAQWLKTVHPDNLAVVEQAFQKAAREGLPLNIEWRVQRRDGSERWLMSQGVPFKDGQGSIRRYLGTVLDITERKRAEEERLKSESHFRALVQTIPDLIWLKDRDGTYLSCNPMFERFYGARQEYIVGKNDYDFVDRELADSFREHDRKAMEAGKPTLNEEWITFADNGQRVQLETIKTPVFDPSGAIIGVLGIGHDITERKRVENALRESETRLQLVLDGSQLGFWDWNIATGEVVRNARWAEMLGYTMEEVELSVKQWTDLHHPDDRDPAWQSINDHLEGRTPVHQIEYRMLTKDGQYKWILDQAKIVSWDAQGKPLRMCGTHTDITERKLAEQEHEKLQNQLTQAQKMESVGRLAGGVAHDFNNMLSVILGYAELAMDQVDPSSSLYQELREIYSAGKRSADITRQLLAFARKQTIAPRILDLNETVEGMLKMLRRLIGEDIALAWLPGSGLAQAKMDPSQLDQLLANLCVNARDAIAGVGKVTVETGMVTFDEGYCKDHAGFTPGDFILLSVSDDGCGMDKEVLQNIFEPFFTTKEVGRGTGLGLATVYGIVKQNNGFVNVYSEPGHGTTFNIYLPVHQSHPGEIQAEIITDIPSGGTETILIVEDDASVLNLGKTMLERLGYTVLTANTPADAIRLAKANAGKIHLVITDVVMPEMNGRDVADQLRTLSPDIKILFMSGYTADVIAPQGILDEGVCFIHKPFSIKDLAVKVREALEQE